MTSDNLPRPEPLIARKQYSEEAAREILRQAMEEETKGKDFSREQLEAMAHELGISPDSLVRAEQRWLDDAPQRAMKESQAAFERHRQWTYRTSLTMFVIATIFLFLLNLVTSPGTWWVIYPLLGGSVGMIIYTWMVRQKEGPIYEQELAQWRAQHPLPPPSDKRLPS